MSDIFEQDISSEDENLASLEEEETSSYEEPSSFSYSKPLYRTRLEYSSEGVYVSVPKTIQTLKAGEYVVIPTRYGKDLALVLGKAEHPVGIRRNDIVTVDRKATEDDLKKYRDHAAKEADAFTAFREKAAVHRLDMKVVAVHFMLEEPKAVFFFSSDNRVDFRELVRIWSAFSKSVLNCGRLVCATKAASPADWVSAVARTVATLSTTSRRPFRLKWQRSKISRSTRRKSAGSAVAYCAV